MSDRSLGDPVFRFIRGGFNFGQMQQSVGLAKHFQDKHRIVIGHVDRSFLVRCVMRRLLEEIIGNVRNVASRSILLRRRGNVRIVPRRSI